MASSASAAAADAPAAVDLATGYMPWNADPESFRFWTPSKNMTWDHLAAVMMLIDEPVKMHMSSYTLRQTNKKRYIEIMQEKITKNNASSLEATSSSAAPADPTTIDGIRYSVCDKRFSGPTEWKQHQTNAKHIKEALRISKLWQHGVRKNKNGTFCWIYNNRHVNEHEFKRVGNIAMDIYTANYEAWMEQTTEFDEEDPFTDI
jgi:hypothetical protein